MNRLPPSVPTELHPDDIIPLDMKQAFMNHYLCTFKNEGPEDFEKSLAAQGIKAEARKHIAMIYEELQLNGWFPLGVTKDDFGTFNIKWGYRVSGPIPDASDMPYKMTPAESREYLNKHLSSIG